ncbi:MAG: imidazole glycerol phosphate synthase subunit HisF [Acholeplasmataceae bacterium]
MLSRRVIVCLDVRDGRVVKGVNFNDLRDVGDPATLGKRYSEEGVDELVFYDITASHERRKIAHSFVTDVAEGINIPFSVGGGIRDLADIAAVLKQGADKVSINSAAIRDPSLIDRAAKRFGSQCVVLSMDVRKEDGTYAVYRNGGRIRTDYEAIAWAKEGVRRGAGELVINSMDADGTKEGFDIDLLNAIARHVDVPVIASGGAGSLEHFVTVATETDVDGYLAASVFHEGSLPIEAVKEALQKAGIPVRLERRK